MEHSGFDNHAETGGAFRLLRVLAVSDGGRAGFSPLAPSRRDMRQYLTAVLICSIPSLGLAAHYFGGRVWVMLAVAVFASAAVEFLFARIRRKPFSGGTLAYSALFVLILPPTIPLWMVALGAASGTLFGKEAFGGVGSYIFNPVLVGKGFLLFSYPQDAQGTYFGSMLGYAEVPDAWLLCTGVIVACAAVFAAARPSNLRILAGILLGAVGVAMPLAATGYLPYETTVEFLAADGLLFGAVFLAVDPACSPQVDEGKWLFGLLAGVTVVLMRCFSNYSEAMFSALLFGNLFTPMIDALALSRREPAPAPEGRAG
jgi:Na+-translocating ferredoxin:NAD+ oxidoreductase RnfD subunit